MSKYKPGDKFLLEVTGVDDSGSRTLYEVNGMSGLFSENVLDKLEKVEDVPVVHGSWVNVDGYDEWECDECGYVVCGYDDSPEIIDMNFCPSCGADMRGKKNED